MATITSALGTDLGVLTSGDSFSYEFTAAVDDPSEGVITSVVITPKYEETTPGKVVIVNGTESATISGEYTNSLWPKTTTSWLSTGQSDKTQTPQIVQGTSRPDEKFLFDLTPDPTQILNQEYVVVATTSLAGDFSETFTLQLFQNYTPYKDYIDGLKASGGLKN